MRLAERSAGRFLLTGEGALAHGTLSFFFNTVVLALSVNIGASLL